MSRYYLQYTTDEQDKNDAEIIRNEARTFTSWPLTLELKFKRRKQLKREIWDNARDKGWLPE